VIGRLPTPPAEYSVEDQNILRRTVETILRQLHELTKLIPDPDVSLNGFAVTNETDTAATASWTRGRLIEYVFVYARTAAIPISSDPWAPMTGSVPVALLGPGEDSYVMAKPPAGQRAFYQFVPRKRNLVAGPPQRVQLEPVVATFDGSIKATVADDLADLTIAWTAHAADYPITLRVREATPDSSPIYTATASADGSASTGALLNRALPLRELQKWWLEIENRAGVKLTFGPTSADRDPLPNGEVTESLGVFRCEYDDDTDMIVVTTPSGTRTYSGLSGGGVVTYTIGSTTLDSSGVEPALTPDEVRAGYTVTYFGGGESRVFFNGSAYGSNKDFTPPTLAVTPTQYTDRVGFTATSDGTITYRVDGGSFTAYSGAFDVYRDGDDPQTVVFKATAANGVTKELSFTVDPTATVAGGDTTVIISAPAVTVNGGTDEFEMTWSSSGLPVGGEFEVAWSDDEGVTWNPAAARTTSHAYDLGNAEHGYNITSGTVHYMYLMVYAYDSLGALVGASPVTVKRFNWI
jgi:hypothetical protein